MITIKKFKSFEKAVKKSFSNVRSDIVTIKNYLEKQHDLINQDIADLQSQIFEIKRDLKSKSKEFEKTYYKKSSAKKGSSARAKTHRELRASVEKLNNQLKQIQDKLNNIDKKKVSESKLEKSLKKIQKNISRLEKEVESNYVHLKKNLTKYKRKVTRKLKSKKRKTGFLASLFSRKAPKKKKSKKKKKKTKTKKQNKLLLPILLIIIAILLGGVGAWYIYNNSPVLPNVQTNQSNTSEPIDVSSDKTVLEVYETDFVNIMPNISDPDQDELNFIFSYPLNKSGQWQTKVGDAGKYPIVVSVSDGQSTTEMEFLLVVHEK